MSYKDWYTINSAPNGFIAVATDADLNYVKQYGITMEGATAGNCGCIAGHTWCRHKKMLVLFQKMGRVDSRWYYNFDREKWKAPQEQES